MLHVIVVKALEKEIKGSNPWRHKNFSNFPKKVEIRVNMITGISRVQKIV